MSEKALAAQPQNDIQRVIHLVLNRLTSEHFKRAYGKALTTSDLARRPGTAPLNKTLVQRYEAVLEESGLSPSTVNLCLSAVRKLAREAADSVLVDQTFASGTKTVKRCQDGGCAIRQLVDHDLQRTFAKLAHKGGAGLDQIQLSLGHASIKTTERCLGIEQDLAEAPCDVLGLQLGE